MDFETTYDAEAKTWSGPKMKSLFDPACSIGRIALFMMKSKPPQTVCQISDSEGTTMTYGEAVTSAIRVAQRLAEMGITQDDVVGVIAPNTTLLMPTAVGCMLNGTAFHSINPIHETHVLRHLLDISKPKVIFCDGRVHGKIQEAAKEQKPQIFTLCNHVEGVRRIEELLEPTGTEMFYQAPPLKYGANQTVAIICSSGTTGLPKGVSISNATLAVDNGFVSGSDVFFSFSTPDWSTGLMNMLQMVINGGTRIVTTRPFDPAYLLELIAKYKVSFLGICPTQMSQAVLEPAYTAETMQSIRLIFMTGNHCTTATLERIRDKLSMGFLLNAYGTTEFSGIAGNLFGYKVLSVGKVIPNVIVSIVDEESGERLGPNRVGEVCAQNGRVWGGYYGNPEATRKMLDPQGWFHTGDLGYFDDEHYLHLVDRSKDILKYRGIHYWPHEIEETVAELPEVVDVCVFGVWNETVGDLAAAAVVLRPGCTLSAEQIVAHVAARQEVEHKRLHGGVFFVAEIPRNANGKVLRRQTRDLCVGQVKQKSSL